MRLVMMMAILAGLVLGANQVATAESRDINGTWNSDYGQVVISVAQDQSVTGYWNQQQGRGEIKRGTYDGFRILEISYYQPWNGANGRAAFRLSDDGRTLDGKWNQTDRNGNTTKGTWILRR